MGYKADMSGAKAKIKAICSNPEVGQFAAEDVMRLSQPYVPVDQSFLMKSAQAEPFLVTWNTPYAHYQWNGISKSGKELKYTKTTAHSHWEQQIDKSELARDITEYLRSL